MKKNAIIIWTSIMFMLSFILIWISIFNYMIAYHNVDVAVNGLVLNAESEYNYVDINSEYETKSFKEIYIEGRNDQKSYLILFGVAMFLFGYTLVFNMLVNDIGLTAYEKLNKKNKG